MTKEIIAQIQTSAYLYRGQLINDVIYIERHIDEALARYFCESEEKRKDIFELILGNERITLSNKLGVFKFICEKNYKEFLKKYPTLIKDLNELMEERNIVAHYLLDTSSDSIEPFENGQICFVKFKNKTEKIIRSQESYNHYHKLVLKSIPAIKEFLS